MGGHGGGGGEPVNTGPRRLLLGVALAYVTLVVLLPFVNVFIQAFHKGVGPFLEHLVQPDFLHATRMTLMLAAVSVPLNSVFGTVAAILITRNEFPGKVLLLSLLDMPFSISPVVTGLMLTLLYGRSGWFASFLADHGFNIVFAFPGMALATMFVTMPFVVRELIPTLEQMDLSQEEAARTLGANPLQVFWHVTLPNIRWGLMYGIILTNARAMGEFGAVSVISGNIIGQTQTLTLFVEAAYKEYNTEAAFAAAVLLSLLALMTLFVKDQVVKAAAAEAAK
ncbi:MAG: ABC transporter type 1, transmembrane domain MetI-like protein [Monoraphidium minutum]|nr:MAG: ABC transporter type 1, transmembrane domain MetI-like protein [Monoraphidium minutum]